MENRVEPITTSRFQSERRWTLPPLILHPFSDAAGPQKLARSSRAGLMLEGLLPPGDMTQEQIERALIEGRFCEIRMLIYVGKDLSRWLEQCLELVQRDPDLQNANITLQSFADMLVHDPPVGVREKLTRWGVVDFRSIFSRAIGLNALFADAPPRELLGTDFIRNYFRFADQMFACRMSLAPLTHLSAANFEFELYASGEYSRMLEREWAG
jgi:hypothetical protein